MDKIRRQTGFLTGLAREASFTPDFSRDDKQTETEFRQGLVIYLDNIDDSNESTEKTWSSKKLYDLYKTYEERLHEMETVIDRVYDIADIAIAANEKLGIIPFGRTSGSGSAYTIELSDVNEIKNGTIIAVYFHVNNENEATLNVNETGAKPIYFESNKIEAGRISCDNVAFLIFDTINIVSGCWRLTNMGSGGLDGVTLNIG